MTAQIYCAASASAVPAAFLRQAGAAARRLGMSKPVILSYRIVRAMSIYFVHRYLATI
jgi:hypothetical protein